MKLTSLIVSAALASAEVGILLPLYEYPTTDSGIEDWGAVLRAMDAHPGLPFHIIINNNGGAPYEEHPPFNSKDWAKLLGEINGKPKSSLLGYISTGSSGRSIDDVKRGIDQYAAWKTHEGLENPPVQHNIQIHGIFFDEIDTDSSKLPYNKEITNYAKTAFQSRGPVILNPGSTLQAGSESLLDIADVVVSMETCYSNSEGATDPDGKVRCPKGQFTPFSASAVDSLPNPSKSSVMLHDFYETWSPFYASSSKLEDTVKVIVGKGVHSFYITTFGYTANFTSGPASVSVVASLAARVQGL